MYLKCICDSSPLCCFYQGVYDSNWEWNQNAIHVHTFGSTSHNLSPLGRSSWLGWLVGVFDGGIILIMLMDDLSTVGGTIPRQGSLDDREAEKVS